MTQVHSNSVDGAFLTPALLRRILGELQELRDEGAPEHSIEEFLNFEYRTFSEVSRKQIYDFSRGKTPKDDIPQSDIASRTELNETTVELQLHQPEEAIQEGALLFLKGKCWKVIAVDASNILLRICR